MKLEFADAAPSELPFQVVIGLTEGVDGPACKYEAYFFEMPSIRGYGPTPMDAYEEALDDYDQARGVYRFKPVDVHLNA